MQNTFESSPAVRSIGDYARAVGQAKRQRVADALGVPAAGLAAELWRLRKEGGPQSRPLTQGQIRQLLGDDDHRCPVSKSWLSKYFATTPPPQRGAQPAA